jgi:hypothetical protein
LLLTFCCFSNSSGVNTRHSKLIHQSRFAKMEKSFHNDVAAHYSFYYR